MSFAIIKQLPYNNIPVHKDNPPTNSESERANTHGGYSVSTSVAFLKEGGGGGGSEGGGESNKQQPAQTSILLQLCALRNSVAEEHFLLNQTEQSTV